MGTPGGVTDVNVSQEEREIAVVLYASYLLINDLVDVVESCSTLSVSFGTLSENVNALAELQRCGFRAKGHGKVCTNQMNVLALCCEGDTGNYPLHGWIFIDRTI
jgi:hypothetical protein